MSDQGSTDRPKTARGYKGPRWLIDRLPRYGSDDGRDADSDFE